jgi:hypothetical protein
MVGNCSLVRLSHEQPSGCNAFGGVAPVRTYHKVLSKSRLWNKGQAAV